MTEDDAIVEDRTIAEETHDADPGPVEPSGRPRRSRTWMLITAGCLFMVLVAGASAWGWNAFAAEHARASVALAEAEQRLSTMQQGVGSGTAAASVSSKEATTVLAMDLEPYAGEAALSALRDAAAALDEEIALGLQPRTKPAVVEPGAAEVIWPWAIVAATQRMQARTTQDRDEIASGKDTIRSLLEADRTVAAAGADLLDAVVAGSGTVLAAYPSARNTARDALARSVEQLGWSPWSEADAALGAFVTAAGELETTQDAELAEKAGPLLDQRLAAEAYARSISGGVMLDFDWADIVVGYGWGDSMAGTAQDFWYTPDEVYSTITLTNSVAARWNDGTGDAQALVAHEVGHAIHPTCFSVYPDDPGTEEQWATAWSISMGHTGDATGVQAYGHPDAAIIAAAANCR